jgi:3-hydroxyisobutyrate dehydrogenase
MAHIAFLGTGLLGSAFVEAAAGRGGDTITVWNRTAEKAAALTPLGVTTAATPADAVARAGRVHLVLKDDAVVDEVIAALRPGLDPQCIIVDHSTTLPALTAERMSRLDGQGVRYLHCPVFIGPAAARQGKGTILVSGPRALYEAVEPALSRMAERVEYFGERPDLAAVYKLCGNALIIGINGLVSDVLSIGANAGVPADETLNVLELFNVGGVVAGRGKSMASRDYAPSFELAMARKDVGLMLEAAGERPLAALPGIAARMDALIAQGFGTDDLAVIGREAVGSE